MRTKGHIFAVPPHFAGRCCTGALITLTVLHTRKVLSGLAIMGLPMLIYFALHKSEFLQQSIQATFNNKILWGLPTYGHTFSISTPTIYSSRRRIVFVRL